MNLTTRVLEGFGPEDHEQYTFVQYLELERRKHGLKFTSVPNSTYTKSAMQRIRNRLLGLRAGLSDIVIAFPDHFVLFIEMKQKRNGDVSPAQREWLDILNTIPGVAAHVAKGADQAIAIYEHYVYQKPLPAKLYKSRPTISVKRSPTHEIF